MSECTQMWNWYMFPRIEVFTSKKKARKFIEEKTGEQEKLLDKGGQVVYLKSTGRDDYAVVIFDKKQIKGLSLSAKVGIIAHECSHVVDDMADSMGEEKLSTEARAYLLDSAVSAVCEQLGEEWFRQ